MQVTKCKVLIIFQLFIVSIKISIQQHQLYIKTMTGKSCRGGRHRREQKVLIKCLQYKMKTIDIVFSVIFLLPSIIFFFFFFLVTFCSDLSVGTKLQFQSINYSLSIINLIKLLPVLWDVKNCLMERVDGQQKHGSVSLLQKLTYLEISTILNTFNLIIWLMVSLGGSQMGKLSATFSKTLKQKRGRAASSVIVLNIRRTSHLYLMDCY